MSSRPGSARATNSSSSARTVPNPPQRGAGGAKPGGAVKKGEEKPKIAVSPADDLSCSAYFRERILLLHFNAVRLAAAKDFRKLAGVYVIPSNESLYLWHGVIFVRSGLYQKGIFKFRVSFPNNFPGKCPNVRFTSRIFHPLIHENGDVNMPKYFPEWDPKNDTVVHVLYVLKRVIKTLFTKSPPCNKEAATLLATNEEAFKAAVADCVKESQEQVFVNTDGGLKFAEYQDHHRELRSQLLEEALEQQQQAAAQSAAPASSEVDVVSVAS